MTSRLFPLVISCLALPFVLLATAATDDPPKASKPGTITGIVRYTGAVPPPQRITTSDGSTVWHSDLVVDPKSKGLRHVVAVLEDAPAQPKLQKAKPVIVDQRDMIFIPRVVAVQLGQTVRFENNDLCNHSVMAASTLAANQFNCFVRSDQPYEHVFEAQKHPVLMGCSLHGWMRAWVYVVPHPWFAVSDAQGEFKIEGVPAGKYTLWLRHADAGHQDRRSVEIKEGENTRVEIEWQKASK